MKKTLQKTLMDLTIMVCSLTSMLTPSLALASDNYVSMLREDRVWEYRSGLFGPMRPNVATYIVMQVVGATTINDVEYKAFGITREMAIHCPSDEVLSDVFFNGDGIKFFLREEEGVVYELFYGNQAYYTDARLDALTLPAEGEDGKYYSEKVLYDATLPNGAGVTLYIGGWEIGGGEWRPLPMVQYQGEELDVQGEACRVFGFYFPEDINPGEPTPYPTTDYGWLRWVEGIGILNVGILPSIGIAVTTGAPAKEMPELYLEEPRLMSVYTPDGVVLYGEAPVAASLKETLATSLNIENSEFYLKLSGQGQLTLTVTGLDGVTVASASGTDEVSVPTEGLGRGVYVVTAKDDSSTRTMKIKI